MLERRWATGALVLLLLQFLFAIYCQTQKFVFIFCVSLSLASLFPISLLHRSALVLKDNEGVYVRSLRSGEVRMVLGPRCYLLAADEQLWIKEMSGETMEVLANGGGLGEGEIRKVGTRVSFSLCSAER